MEELKQFLIDNEVLGVFCEVILDDRTKSRSSIEKTRIYYCICDLFSWQTAQNVFITPTRNQWESLHDRFSSQGPKTLFECTREELVAYLKGTKRMKLHLLVKNYKI